MLLRSCSTFVQLAACAGGLILASFPTAGCAQSAPPTAPPPGVTGYSLVYEENFATDPSNANGELQNVVGSSSNPLRPQWLYRPGAVHNCTNVQGSSNIFLSQNAQGRVPGLTIRDIASQPSATNAAFTTGPNEAYQTYTCGGIISNIRFGFGYYESYASLNVATPNAGFHTSFWTYNDYGDNANETDIFENESADNTSGKGFAPGIFAWNVKGGAPNPNPHPYTGWSSVSGGYSSPHAFGVLISPKTHQFYVDGNGIAGTAATPGPYIATEVYLTSVGSLQTSPYNSAKVSQPWIQYDGSHSSLNFDYSFQYLKYYQATDPKLVSAQALPPGSIFIDATVPAGYVNSTFTPGNFKPYLAYPYNGAVNPNLVWGPQGFRGQNAYASAVAGDTASWSHTFTAADAGSYDVFIWNAAVGTYQLPSTTSKIYAPDAASHTQYQLTGSTGAAPASQIISQRDSGQSWVPLNSTSADLTPTNTYAFAAGSTATITLTVGTESSTDTTGAAFTPHTDADSVAFVPVSTFGITNGAVYSDSGFVGSSLQGWAGSPAARYSTMQADALARATWTAPLPSAGTYTVYAYTPGDTSTTNYAKYTVIDGSTVLGSSHVDQATQDNYWVAIGTYTWTGTTATVTVQNGDGSSHPANGYLRTNAIKFVPQLLNDYYVCTTSTGFYGAPLYSTSGAWSAGNNGYSGCGGVDQVAFGSGASATFSPQVPVAGFYHAYLYNDPALDPSTKVVVQSHSAYPSTCSGITTAGSTQWIYLGDYYFGPESFQKYGSSSLINDSIVVSSTGGSVGASAIKLRYSGAVGTATPCVNN